MCVTELVYRTVCSKLKSHSSESRLMHKSIPDFLSQRIVAKKLQHWIHAQTKLNGSLLYLQNCVWFASYYGLHGACSFPRSQKSLSCLRNRLNYPTKVYTIFSYFKIHFIEVKYVIYFVDKLRV
jgi:hypothetical protein